MHDKVAGTFGKVLEPARIFESIFNYKVIHTGAD